MTSDFLSLPPELRLAIIAHVPQLRAFALTNKTNYQIAAYTLLQRAINNKTCRALEKFHPVLRCLCAWMSPLALRDLYVRHKAMKQLQAGRLCDACDTLAVLHAMPEMGSISDRCFDDVLLRLQTLLVQSTAVDNYDDAERIVSLVGRPPSQMLGGCVDMTLTIYDQVRKAIDTGHLDRAESVLALVVRFRETSIPKGRFDDLLPWIEERATKAFDDGRTMDARALESAADLLYAKCIEEASLPNSVHPVSTPELLMK